MKTINNWKSLFEEEGTIRYVSSCKYKGKTISSHIYPSSNGKVPAHNNLKCKKQVFTEGVWKDKGIVYI